ncbi:hypothetical protein NYE69_27095 [Paenibacillus sp. FSL R5-0527]|uniref:hypothetical protein n=1 Tax=Paenibacillus sp. FSL R5-0527 TaxID=2975321 RepID=UPI00097A22EA|nr:hypothetical protein BK140_22390 [Paenibacillus macerans]
MSGAERNPVRRIFRLQVEKMAEAEKEPQLLVVAVKLPSGAFEVITNTQDLKNKIDYYLNAYDDDFRLKVNQNIQIVEFMLV